MNALTLIIWALESALATMRRIDPQTAHTYGDDLFLAYGNILDALSTVREVRDARRREVQR